MTPFDPSQFEFVNGVYFQKGIPRPGAFEKAYLELRRKEQRVYSDVVVGRLPDTSPDHRYAGEWKARRASAEMLCNYLSQRKPRSVLELGCGNGWLTHQLAGLAGTAIGLDCNEEELTQAARVFQYGNTSFIYGDIFTCPFPHGTFDTIVLASSLQYFPDVASIVNRCMQLLSVGGELNILDTPVYTDAAAAKAAAQRSVDYFVRLGMPAMIGTYFHHTIKDLELASAEMIFNPKGLSARVRSVLPGQTLPVFPWFRICKK